MNRRDLIRMLGGGVAGIPAVASIEKLQLEKQDTLVVSYEGRMSHEASEHIKATFENVFPGQKVIVLTDGLKLKVIREA